MDYQNLSKAELEKEYGHAVTHLKQVGAARNFSLEGDNAYTAAAEVVYKLRRELYRRRLSINLRFARRARPLRAQKRQQFDSQ